MLHARRVFVSLCTAGVLGGAALVVGAGAASAAAPSSLASGHSLTAGQALVSPDGAYEAVMQGDGNFVVYGPTGATFATRTSAPGSFLAVQADGNVVIYGPAGPTFATHTDGDVPANDASLLPVLRMQDDGNLVLYRGDDRALWSSRYGPVLVGPSGLLSGQSLPAGGILAVNRYQAAGIYQAVMQRDGNFVVYGPEGVRFASNTFVPNSVLVMQSDGNLVIYGPHGPTWATGTRGTKPGLLMQDDGNAVVYCSGRPLWSSDFGLVPPG